MLRKTVLFSALAAFGLAGAAHSEEHYVLMLGQGYFPDAVHPEIGDTIRFVNITEIPMSATAVDDSWTTGQLAETEEHVITVTEGLTTEFDNRPPPAAEPDIAEVDAEAQPFAEGVIDYVDSAPVILNSDGQPILLQDADYDSRDDGENSI